MYIPYIQKGRGKLMMLRYRRHKRRQKSNLQNEKYNVQDEKYNICDEKFIRGIKHCKRKDQRTRSYSNRTTQNETHRGKNTQKIKNEPIISKLCNNFKQHNVQIYQAISFRDINIYKLDVFNVYIPTDN